MRSIPLFCAGLVIVSVGGAVFGCLSDSECRLFYDCPENEAGRTCGQPGQPACSAGAPCADSGECAGQECVQGVCKANCADGVENNDETDVDCGPGCAPCPQGRDCIDAAAIPRDDACESHSCVDGVCCEEPCAGECEACVTGKTGARDGTCAPVLAGTDPDEECRQEAPGTCGSSDGMCSGHGSCKKHDKNTPCGPGPSCEGGFQTVQSHCDGEGTCIDMEPISCDPYVCEQDKCRTSCESNDDCKAGYYCHSKKCSTHFLGDLGGVFDMENQN